MDWKNESGNMIHHPCVSEKRQHLKNTKERRETNEKNKTMNEKKKKWRQIRSKVNRLADSLGRRIDVKIRESVTALLSLDFNVSASCTGHTRRGIAAPWIDIGEDIPITQIKRKSKRELKILKAKNLREQERLMELLDEFYRGKEVPNDIRLVLEQRGIYGNARLVSTGERFQEIRPKREREERLEQYREEMRQFTEFLKQKYFDIAEP